MRNPNRRFRRCGDVRYRVLGEEAVVVRQDDAEVLVVNEVGARILDLSDGETSVGVIAACLREEFEAPPDLIEADVERFVTELRDAGVLEEATDSSLDDAPIGKEP